MLRRVSLRRRVIRRYFAPGLRCAFVLSFSALAAACSGGASGQVEGGAGSAAHQADAASVAVSSGGDDAGADAGACNVRAQSFSGLTQVHVAVCSAVTYRNDPPAGGDHYPVWAAYQSYSFPVPRGFWVHDLEHGGVVFSYNCADGCADEVADVQALIDALPIDDTCSADEPRRAVLTPDPLLDVRWGVSAWGHTLRADCVDGDRFRQFYLDHFGQGPEAVCSNGSDFGGTPPCQ
jgi:hypothetical protein